MLLVGGPISAFADESFTSPTRGLLDPPAPSLTRQSSGFELETPAEQGAAPINRFVLRAPKPVAPFPIQMSRYVKRYLSDYLTAPDALQDSFDRSQPYLPEMVRVLRSYGLPDDLVYLAFAESEFSKKGKGPWQFNLDTARRFGLHVDSYVDERRDPVLSTKAAAEYLATLHDAAGDDWPMTVVGWNNGDQSIDRYWSLRGPNFEKFGNRLPRRTKMLLGRFMAVTYIARHAESYGITTIKLDVPPPYQTLRVHGGTALSRIALDHGTTLKRIHELNPALLRDVVPAYGRSYSVRIPIEQRASSGLATHF
ncbi:MAG: transglycosylase SLT domain-containing protein [Candidatus Binatus sp.]|nr:transglycosylase SLT domain-containing protein [Candidatus Binatus sp.]